MPRRANGERRTHWTAGQVNAIARDAGIDRSGVDLTLASITVAAPGMTAEDVARWLRILDAIPPDEGPYAKAR
jgi:hypothetical protein